MLHINLYWRIFLEKGDSNSFSYIYNNLVDDLHSYGVSLGYNNEICKDAIQDTFYNLFVNKDKLHNIKNFTSYIFRSFRNRLVDITRKDLKNENLESDNETFTMDITILDNIIEDEVADILKTKVQFLLSQLNDNQKQVVYLRYMIGMEHKEIAEVLNIKEESSRKLLYRTMEKLRENIS